MVNSLYRVRTCILKNISSNMVSSSKLIELPIIHTGLSVNNSFITSKYTLYFIRENSYVPKQKSCANNRQLKQLK